MENLKTQLKNIGVAMSVTRALSPPKNRPKYDVEAKDHFAAMSAAAENDDEKRFNQLVDRWNTRAWYLSIIPDCHLAPPALVHRDGESREDYINRCYQAHMEIK